MAEILFVILEFIFEFLLEFALEFMVDFGLRAPFADRAPLPAPWGTIVAVTAYSTLSYFLALGSVAVFPHHFIRNPEYRLWNVLLTPILMGVLMGQWGGYLRERGKRVLQIDTYVLGFFFALIFALVRYKYAS